MKLDYIMERLLIFVTIFAMATEGKMTLCNDESLLKNPSLRNLEVNCKTQNLTRFPMLHNIRTQIKVFNLQYNRIEIIQSGSLNNYSSLLELNLSANAIRRIEDYAFIGAKRMEKLDLSSNMISSLKEVDFEKSLVWLSVARNSLRTIPAHLLHLEKLKHLDLSNNHFISRISEGSLPPSLTELNLRFTSIKYISHATFSRLADLKKLDLSDNMASSSLTFSERPFDGLKSLEYIDLSRSFVRKLRPDSFTTLKKLKVLLMNNCWMTSFPELYESLPNTQTASPMTIHNQTYLTWYNPKLELLDLSNNRGLIIKSQLHLPPSLIEIRLNHCRIPAVDAPLFKTDSAALVVDLSYSAMTSLCEDAFSKAILLTHVALTGNPITSIPRLPESLLYLNLSKTNIASVSRNSLVPLHKLQEVKLNQGAIQHVDDYSFQNMSSLRKMDLSQNKLRKLKKNTLIIGTRRRRALRTHKVESRLLELNISSNFLTQISRKAFSSHSHLRILDLSNNEIKRLEVKQFDGLQNLQELSLQMNSIAKIDPRAFAGLNKLKILHLEDNRLNFLDDGTFANMPSLTKLFLQNNMIQHLARPRLPSLEYIDLSNNHLWRIPRLPVRIHTIKARVNNIVNFPYSVIEKVKNLEVLELDDCMLNHVNFSIFYNNPVLKTISLSNNDIKDITDVKIPSLVHLNMTLNKIEQIPKNFSESFPKLKSIDLRFNNISYIDPSAFKGLRMLKHLFLNYNAFECDCKLRDFVQWLIAIEKTDIVTDSGLYQCQRPIEEYSMPVLETVTRLSNCALTTPTTNTTEAATTPPESNSQSNTIILGSCIALLLLFVGCIVYVTAKKWTVKIKLRVNENNNKHLRGKAVKCDETLHLPSSQNTKIT